MEKGRKTDATQTYAGGSFAPGLRPKKFGFKV